MEQLILSTGGWAHGPIHLARGFVGRWRGLSGLEPGSSILLHTRSVHSFGMGTPIRVLGLSSDYVVNEVRTLLPWSIAVFPGSRLVVEMPLSVIPPPIGSRLEVRHV